MPKRMIGRVKFFAPAGQATPAPPVGPTLGQYGINIMEFCKAFNEQTADNQGTIIPVELTIFDDRSFSFICKTPPVAQLLKKAAGIEKGSGVPNREKVGKVARAKVEEIAKLKMPDLNTQNLESAIRVIEGTARSMGIEIAD